MNLEDRARQLKRDIPALFLALRSSQTPPAARALAGVAVVYALSPVDLIPDFFPVVGYLDDLVILPALIALTVRLIPEDVMTRCRAQAEAELQTSKGRWYYAVPFVLIWVVVGLLVLKAVLSW